MLESTEKGEVRKTVGNYRLILMNDPNLQGAFRLNMFTDKIDITRDLGWYRESDSLTDVDLKFLVVYLEKHYGLSNEKRIEDVIKVVANENRYHPVLDRINSITWDGRERIRYALHHFLGAEVSEYTYEVMKLFMIGTIARISCPGIKFEVMLCLVGGQGAGKSTFLRFLASGRSETFLHCAMLWQSPGTARYKSPARRSRLRQNETRARRRYWLSPSDQQR